MGASVIGRFPRYIEVSNDRGADVVLLSLGETPEVPFEDLAVAKGEIETGDLIRLGIQAMTVFPSFPK